MNTIIEFFKTVISNGNNDIALYGNIIRSVSDFFTLVPSVISSVITLILGIKVAKGVFSLG